MYQQELEKQLEEQERRKQDAYEEFLKEKFIVDEIVRKIYEEDEMLVTLNFYYLLILNKTTLTILCRKLICIHLFHRLRPVLVFLGHILVTRLICMDFAV